MFARVYGPVDGVHLLSLYRAFLQGEMDGELLQRTKAAWDAIWRCRCTLMRGLHYHNFEDLCGHFRRLVEGPWLLGSPVLLTRSERRAQRMHIPS